MPLTNKKITECTALAVAPAADDVLAIVDVDDTTDDPSGTSKQITVDFLRALTTRVVSSADAAEAEDDIVFLDPTSASFQFDLLPVADRNRPLYLKNVADPATSINTATIAADGAETFGPTDLTVVLNPGERITIVKRTSAIWEIIA